MGACCGKEAGPDADAYRQGASSRLPDAPQRSRQPDTPQDQAARSAAAEAAAARQQQFEQSATGRAAIKAVKAVKEERAAGRPSTANDTAADWLT